MVEVLGKNIIHSVTNPCSDFTAAIHVYAGNFFTVDRSEWDPEQLDQQPYDVARNKERFERANVKSGDLRHRPTCSAKP